MPLISPMEWTGSGTVHLKHVQHFRTRKEDGVSLSTQAKTFILYLRCHKPHIFHIAQSKVWPLSFYNIPTILQIAVKGYACFVCEKNIGGGDVDRKSTRLNSSH